MITQTEYFHKIIKKFQLDEAKSVKTQFAKHFKLSVLQSPVTEHELAGMKPVPYANLVGSLMYDMVCCRPDLVHALSMVSRYMCIPRRAHWEASKWIVRYLKGTTNRGLIYTKVVSMNDNITGYVDSDYAVDLDKRHSLTGYIFTLYGKVISWRSNLQSVVALSSTEAEYIALSKAVKEVIWLKRGISEMMNEGCDVKIYCDSQSAIALSKNPTFHDSTKHIDVKFHFIRGVVQEGEVKIEKINTIHNPVDTMKSPFQPLD